ncbi:hypothetical protein SK128_026147 [Halocaridina rubra]|uniref:G-protein coupled receptors family 1 profile domain-containing protein n=1 Tax=Halocaridina rubra TaxID=373956 RepID=A0AAN9AGS5_HALRR
MHCNFFTCGKTIKFILLGVIFFAHLSVHSAAEKEITDSEYSESAGHPGAWHGFVNPVLKKKSEKTGTISPVEFYNSDTLFTVVLTNGKPRNKPFKPRNKPLRMRKKLNNTGQQNADVSLVHDANFETLKENYKRQNQYPKYVFEALSNGSYNVNSSNWDMFLIGHKRRKRRIFNLDLIDTLFSDDRNEMTESPISSELSPKHYSSSDEFHKISLNISANGGFTETLHQLRVIESSEHIKDNNISLEIKSPDTDLMNSTFKKYNSLYSVTTNTSNAGVESGNTPNQKEVNNSSAQVEKSGENSKTCDWACSTKAVMEIFDTSSDENGTKQSHAHNTSLHEETFMRNNDNFSLPFKNNRPVELRTGVKTEEYSQVETYAHVDIITQPEVELLSETELSKAEPHPEIEPQPEAEPLLEAERSGAELHTEIEPQPEVEPLSGTERSKAELHPEIEPQPEAEPLSETEQPEAELHSEIEPLSETERPKAELHPEIEPQSKLEPQPKAEPQSVTEPPKKPQLEEIEIQRKEETQPKINLGAEAELHTYTELYSEVKVEKSELQIEKDPHSKEELLSKVESQRGILASEMVPQLVTVSQRELAPHLDMTEVINEDTQKETKFKVYENLPSRTEPQSDEKLKTDGDRHQDPEPLSTNESLVLTSSLITKNMKTPSKNMKPESTEKLATEAHSPTGQIRGMTLIDDRELSQAQSGLIRSDPKSFDLIPDTQHSLNHSLNTTETKPNLDVGLEYEIEELIDQPIVTMQGNLPTLEINSGNYVTADPRKTSDFMPEKNLESGPEEEKAIQKPDAAFEIILISEEDLELEPEPEPLAVNVFNPSNANMTEEKTAISIDGASSYNGLLNESSHESQLLMEQKKNPEEANVTGGTSPAAFSDNKTETVNTPSNGSLLGTNATDDEDVALGNIQWSGGRITLFIVQFIIMIETILGNLMVILSVKVEKKLQTPFNYYIVNLAFTDMNVGMSVMSLFMIYNLYDYFPFNNFLCGYWIWSDYTMTFESVMTLAAISVDRLWSVTWSLHYRNHNSGKKSLLIILSTWILVALIWLPPFFYDRFVNVYDPGNCYWDTVLNKNLVLWVGFMGYYSPLFIMIGAYARIMWVVRKRAASIRDQVRKESNPTVSQK